jgi:hypothetical protein
MNNVLNLGDEEGIGEKDDEVIPDTLAVIIADESVEAELEEFVDGVEAFVDADDDSVVDIDEDVSPQAGTETNAESSADNARDEDENTNEETNNV